MTPEPLPPEAVEAVFGMLVMGASPAAACGRLGVDVRGFHLAVELDDALGERLDRVRDDLAWNVAATLYTAAIQGNVAAMTNYLKLRPPRDWRDDATNTDDLYDALEDRHLHATATATGTTLPPDVAGVLQASGQPPVAGGVSPPPPPDGTGPADVR